MDKKLYIVTGCCLFAVALLLAVYGAGFSWRNVIVVGIALVLLRVGEDLWKTAFRRPFRMLQFRIGISHMGLALKDAGLYGDELEEATKFVSQEMQGRAGLPSPG